MATWQGKTTLTETARLTIPAFTSVDASTVTLGGSALDGRGRVSVSKVSLNARCTSNVVFSTTRFLVRRLVLSRAMVVKSIDPEEANSSV